MSHDIGVITTCDDETTAIVDAFGLRAGRGADSGTVFDGDVPLRRGAVRLVCVQGGDDALVRLRERFAPPVMALVGVAGRGDAGARPGDVVVSDEVVHAADTTVTSAVMRRAVNHFFSVQGEPIEWGDGPYRVLRGRIGDRAGGVLAVDGRGSDVAHACLDGDSGSFGGSLGSSGSFGGSFGGSLGGSEALRGWVAVLGIADSGVDGLRGLAAGHAAMVFRAMLPVLVGRRSLVGSPS